VVEDKEQTAWFILYVHFRSHNVNFYVGSVKKNNKKKQWAGHSLTFGTYYLSFKIKSINVSDLHQNLHKYV
jgi:hypothetical protein